MASSEADSRLSQLVVPALEKIVKNASWRKHAKLAHECKSVIERLTNQQLPPGSPSDEPENSPPGPLHDGGPVEYSLAESESILSPLINAAGSGVLKIADPAVDAIQKLIAHGYLRGEADPGGAAPEAKLLSNLIESVCKCHDLGDDAMELLLLKTLLSAVTSISLRIHGDCLLLIVRTCYDIYLLSKNVVNQTTAKASLIQMLVIVFRRMEADSSTVPIQPIVVAELMEPVEKSDVDNSMTQFVQGFITRIMQDIDGVLNPVTPSKISSLGGHDGAFETTTVETTNPTDLLDSTDKDMLDAKYWEISMYKTDILSLHTPCHTKGHISYYVTGKEDENPAVFTGDTLFIAGCGKFFEGTAEQMYQSLCVTLSSLPKPTRVYCGHEYTMKNLQFAITIEPENLKIQQKLTWAQEQQEAGQPTIPSTIEEELETNPFMRVDLPLVQEIVSCKSPVEALREIRKRKDNWRG